MASLAAFTPVPLPLTALTRPVTAWVVVQFGPVKCAATAPSVLGRLPPGFPDCNASAIAVGDRTDTLLPMTSLSGIGVNWTLSVAVVEPTSRTDATPRRYNASAGASSVPFSFLPPSLQFIFPSVASMDSRPDNYLLQFRVTNIGLPGDLALWAVPNPTVRPAARV